MNKEQAKLKLETDIINYKNKAKFLDPSSIYTRWLSDAQSYAEMALRELEKTGEHYYKDEPWKDAYTHVLTDREILEFLLPKEQLRFKIPEHKTKAIRDKEYSIQAEATEDLPEHEPLGNLSEANRDKYWGAREWAKKEHEKLSKEARKYYEQYLKELKGEHQ